MFYYNKLNIVQANEVDRIVVSMSSRLSAEAKEKIAKLLLTMPKPR